MSTATTHDVIVIGSGFAGLGAAIRLREAGVEDLVILERSDSVGGTWRDNRYPGAACDIPAHLYSFSFAPRTDWSTVYPQQPEIRAYLEDLADDRDLRRHLAFGATVASATFDEETATWTVTAEDGRTWCAPAVVMAVGPLSDPKVPDVAGRDRFGGAQFHSNRWDHDVDLDGERVVVVGTGASAIQFVPHVVERAAEVTIVQRSAPWVMPRADRSYTRVEKAALARIPGLRRLYRTLVYWQKELRFVGFREGNVGMKLMERLAAWHMRRSIDDPDLRQKLTPDHAMGCKRILIHNGYYPAVARDHVTVTTEGVTELTEDAVVLADGRAVPADVVIWATGFAVEEPLGAMEVTGLGGRSLVEDWDPHPFAYRGTTVPGYPNLLMLLGPNTGLGHNSMIHVMESQFPYIVEAVTAILGDDVAYVDVRADLAASYQDQLRDRHGGLVWASGCNSWYLGEDGHNFTLWPGFTFAFRRLLRRFDLDAYHVVRPGDLPVRRREEAPASA